MKFNELNDTEKRHMLYEIWEDFERVAEEVFEVRHYPMTHHVTIQGIELNGDVITVAYDILDESHCSGNHEIWEDIPLKYVWDFSWVNKERQDIHDKQMKMLREQSAQDKIDKIKADRAEEELYLKLKKKYE